MAFTAMPLDCAGEETTARSGFAELELCDDDTESEGIEHVKRLVITGGPCAGKTTALAWLQERFAREGVAAVFVPEAATDLIMRNIAPWTCESMRAFQTQVIALQLEQEAATIDEISPLGPDALIIFDRGICDSHAYLSDEDFARALAENGLNERDALARYDAVFHLESVAKIDPRAYTKANNPARFETAEEAAAVDTRVLSAWAAHPHVSVIGSCSSFEGKFELLVREIERIAEHEAGAVK